MDIRIRWQQDSLMCEFRAEGRGGWLYVFRGRELVRKEPVASATAAYGRARELADVLIMPRGKLA